MAFNYSGLKGTASKLLKKFGGEVFLIDLDGIETTAIAAEINAKLGIGISGATMQEGDINMLLGADAPITKHHKIRKNGITYQVIKLEKLTPGATNLLYNATLATTETWD